VVVVAVVVGGQWPLAILGLWLVGCGLPFSHIQQWRTKYEMEVRIQPVPVPHWAITSAESVTVPELFGVFALFAVDVLSGWRALRGFRKMLEDDHD